MYSYFSLVAINSLIILLDRTTFHFAGVGVECAAGGMACVVSPEVLESTSSKTNEHQLLPQESARYNSFEQPTRNDPKDAQEKWRCYHQKGSIYEHAVYFTSLATASYVGVLVRIYSSELAHWDGVALFPSLYPQIVGTIIMGFISSHQHLLASKHVFLYQAIATGLCGSITTFSSWNSEAVSSLLQTGQEPPDNIVRVLAWSTTLLLGLGMSSAALTVGRHLLPGLMLSCMTSMYPPQSHLVAVVMLVVWKEECSCVCGWLPLS